MKPFVYLALLALMACNSRQNNFDATGIFEADEVIVSSETGGKILHFPVQEGDVVSQGKVVALIDSSDLSLQKEQVRASMVALNEKTSDVRPQIRLLERQMAVQQVQLASLEREKKRTENLLKEDAAPAKQLDDLNTQIEVLRQQLAVTEQQIAVQRSQTGTQNRSVLSEKSPLQKRMALLEEQLERSQVTNPIHGTVLVKYAEAGEVTAPGKALYKVADLSTLTLRAYLTGAQLTQAKLNQPVKVLVDKNADEYKELPGTIYWIASQAEFTPKTIQTKEERANLVYAVKIRVKNDGYLKLGMYGEVRLN
jgi:HlyD family secretion protein